MTNVLIIKIGAIGDVIMALPLAKYLTEVKGASITWVCGNITAPILKNFPFIDELIEVDEAALLKGSVYSKGIEILKLWRRLGFKKWDLKITAHADPRYKILSLLTRGRSHRYFQRSKDRSIPISGPIPGPISVRYHGQEYLRLALDSDGPDNPRPEMPLWTFPFPKKWENLLKKNYIILAPGGAKNTLADDAERRWPIEYYVSLAAMLLKEGYQVVVTGGQSDAWVKPHFQGISVADLVGQTTLPELVTLYQQCQFCVTHDSGHLHMAILARSPIVALFGPTNPLERIPREYENVHVIWGGEKLPCRPCYDGKKFALCKDHRCLKETTPSQVFELISRKKDARQPCSSLV
jgi:heptosyltransferase-2